MNRSLTKKLIAFICTAVLGGCVLGGCAEGIDNQAKQELIEACQKQATNATMDLSMDGHASYAGESSLFEATATGEYDAAGSFPKFHLDIKTSGTEDLSPLEDFALETFFDEKGLTFVVNGESMLYPMEEFAKQGLDFSQLGTSNIDDKSTLSEEDLGKLFDTAKSLKKSTSGDKSVYTMVFDPKKIEDALAAELKKEGFASDFEAGSVSSLLKDLTIVYTVDSDGYICEFQGRCSLAVDQAKVSVEIEGALTSIGTTTVPAAPAAEPVSIASI